MEVNLGALPVDALGHVLAALTTPANQQDRAQIFDLCLEVQAATGVNMEVASADQGDTGAQTALDASEAGVELVVIKRPEATKGWILLPRCWVVGPSFARLSRFYRLGQDLERLPSTLVGVHVLAACILLSHHLNLLLA
ncbi:hypothetical protein HLB42_17740 (plasmid) [Deinococcus sp. D7000]|nr:hypothetical protein HLB42_17740 [Deinococcus sp. D7000]